MSSPDAPPVPMGRPESRRATWAWAGAALLTVLLAAAIPLQYHGRYYFFGDTQVGSFPQWYHLGQLLRDGQWPLLDLQSWRGGNFVAEGQWGLFSPLIMAIGLGATTVSNAVLYSSAVKILTLLLAALGTFLLTRSYRAPAPAAYVAAVAVPAGGVTQYLDSPSWMTGLLVWALLPWAWWAIRRTMLLRANPAPALVASLLIVTVGYVYGTMFLALVIAVCLVDTLVARDRAAFVRVLVIGICAGLVAVTVYLPGMLTADVTVRDDWRIANDGRLTMEPRGLIVSVLPTGIVPTSVTQQVFNPLGYIAWFLPALLWLDLGKLRGRLRDLVGLGLMLAATTLWALGPSDIGPLRWPLRVMPFVVLGTVVLTAVLLSRGLARVSGARLGFSLSWVAIAAWLSASRAVSEWRGQFVSLLVVGTGLLILWLVCRWAGSRGRRTGLAALLAVVVGFWSLGLAVVQHHFYPLPPSLNRNMPTHVEDYATPLQEAQGDVMLLGDPVETVIDDADAADEFLLGSSWYVNPHPVQSTYTTIGFASYVERYCIGFIGNTCPRALPQLFSTEPTTGLPRVDLLSISTLLLVKKSFAPADIATPPAGWRVAKETAIAVTWVREQPLPSAGGIVWSTDGTRVRQLSSDARTLRFRVEATGPDGGSVVASRLAWPGYSADHGATIGSLVDDYLLAVKVAPGSAGTTVTVHYSPPGWPVEVGALMVSLVTALVWSIGVLVVGRRRQADDAQSAAATVARQPGSAVPEESLDEAR